MTVVLVRAVGRRGHETLLATDPPTSPRPSTGPASCASRPAGPCCPAGRDDPARVHRAGLPGRPGRRGVRDVGHDARRRRCPPGCASRPAARAPVHAVHQGGRGGHDENIDFAAGGRPVGADRRRGGRQICLALYAAGGPRAADAGLSSPTPSSSSASSTGSWPSATRWYARLVPAVAGRPGRARLTPPAFDKQPLRDWLPRWAGTGRPPRRAPPRGGRAHHGALRGRLRAGHRAAAGRLVRCGRDEVRVAASRFG